MAYYNYDRALSYNALFSFILTTRGLGKTYGAKVRVIKRFLKYGEQFVYLRRYKDELSTIDTFFNDIINNNEFEGHEFKVHQKKFYIDGKLCGYAIPLSISQRLKSTSYPYVTTIIFDEFIINTSNIRYLTNEVVTFLEFFETVARRRDNVRALFLANNVSLINPYFQYFNCVPKENNRFTLAKDGQILVEVFKDDDFNEEKYQTKFGKLIKDTTYGNYAIENESLVDNDKFVQPYKPKDLTFAFSIKFNNTELGYWISFKDSVFYVSKDIQPTSKHRYTLTKDDHDIDFVMYDKLSAFPMFKEFIRYFRYGYVRFKDIEIKSVCYSTMKYMNVR